jgi:hypothetical protein
MSDRRDKDHAVFISSTIKLYQHLHKVCEARSGLHWRKNVIGGEVPVRAPVLFVRKMVSSTGSRYGIVLVSALKCISAVVSSERYITQAVVKPWKPIGENAPDATTDLRISRDKRLRKLQKSYKESKLSKSDKSTKQETHYLIVFPPPPTLQSSTWLGTNSIADN